MYHLRTGFLITCVILLSGCATPSITGHYMDPDGYTYRVVNTNRNHNPDIVSVVFQEQFKNVLIVKREQGSAPNNHPLEIESEDIVSLLKQVKIRKSDAEPEAMFESEELLELSKWLPKALRQATPDQDIIVHFIQKRGWGFISENVMTTWRMFVADGQLNIIFGNIQDHYEGQWLHTNVLRMYNPGTREKSQLDEWQVLKNKNTISTEKQRKDWIKISLRKQGIVTPSAPAPSAEIRLEQLKNLKDKNLIDDGEYQEKRKQILENL